jgi:hypothetical protein
MPAALPSTAGLPSAALVVAVATLALGGCGEPSREEFAAQVDEVCAAEASAFKNLIEGAQAERTDVVSQLERGAEIREEALAALRELEPPEELRQPFDDYLELREEGIDVTRTAVEAAERGDRETLDVATAALADRVAETDLTASQLGADECVSQPGE